MTHKSIDEVTKIAVFFGGNSECTKITFKFPELDIYI